MEYFTFVYFFKESYFYNETYMHYGSLSLKTPLIELVLYSMKVTFW